jgi:hypothetical protein
MMRVFLSYALKDKRVALQIAEYLKRAGFETWTSEEVLPGDNWHSAASDALERSDAMVVLVSPESMASESVRREIEYALGSARYADRVVPVVVRPARQIPWFLGTLRQVRARPLRLAGRRIVEALKHSPAAANAKTA